MWNYSSETLASEAPINTWLHQGLRKQTHQEQDHCDGPIRYGLGPPQCRCSKVSHAVVEAVTHPHGSTSPPPLGPVFESTISMGTTAPPQGFIIEGVPQPLEPPHHRTAPWLKLAYSSTVTLP
ncbi:hypothetical protein L3X38_036430 [Prunus dulcis]|uniref:Uncharacterized protein n=1 Tax=Prunus dulcis TaxID=3755 RepID=A0AAD4V2I8_PRUDU|nr:hypothetical protein L3X38_036430 [Prunus dulcis]